MTTTGHPQDRLSAYADDELPADERDEVDAHVRECAACRRELEGLRAVDEAARALPVRVPEGYFDSFPARVRERLAARRRRTVPPWTWAAAAALLLAVITPLTLMSRKELATSPARTDVPAQAPAPTAAAPAGPASDSLKGLGYVEPRAEPAPQAQAQARAQAQPRAPAPARRDAAGGQKSEARERLAARDAAADAPLAPGRPGHQLAYELPEPRTARPGEERDETTTGLAGEPPAAPPPPAVVAGKAARRKAASGKATEESVAVEASPGAAAPAMARSAETEGAALRQSMASADTLAALAARPQTTAAEARAAAAAYRAYAQRHAGTDEADEARVRAMEALAAAWHMDHRPADRDSARREARLYLAAPGPRSERVRVLLARLER